MTNGISQFRTRFLALLGLVALVCAGIAQAQLPVPPSSQFDITGFLQDAKLDGIGAGALQGGHLTVNGHVITVPSNTIVILPANALTWQELFAQAPAPYGPTQTGMAYTDSPTPMTTYEVHVIGNRVLGGPAGADLNIAGLIFISQQSLASGAGFISFIDYTAGEMRIGGTVTNPPSIDPNNPGARLRFNDPRGRYGRATTSPDIRFTVDPDNPTVISATGFPMCFPRSAPAGGVTTDALCPEENRPTVVGGGYASTFTTNNLTNPNAPINPGFPRSDIQAPFEVGDYVTYSGTLVQDCALCTGGGTIAGPWPAAGTSATWVAAHTIVNNIAIYTFPGSNPAYVQTDTALMGTGGLNILGAGEASIRTRFEGMMTDPSRVIHLWGMDYTPGTGAETDRDWGMIGIDQGPPKGALKGRWRFRPPCTQPIGSPTDKACSPPPAGTFLPPTREVRAVIVDLATGVVSNPGNASTAANGIIYGQYHAPITDYVFPENIPGSPIVENNFNAIDFLALGGYTSSANTLVGVLNPWPSNIPPASACTAPVANAGGPYTVASGGTVTLNGSATGSTPMTFSWAPVAAGSLSDPTLAGPVYTAPVGGQVVALSLTATNSCGSNTAASSITVNAPLAPTASVPTAITVSSGTPVSLAGTGVDPNVPALAVNFVWTQTNVGAAGVPTVLANPFTCAQAASPITCTLSFIPQLPIGQTANATILFTGQTTNSAGVSSAIASTSVTVKPAADIVTITSAQYRTSKQRLTINATSSVISPNVVLTLQPYVTSTGTLYDPCKAGTCTFTNNGGGLYILDVAGPPPPACGNPAGYATPCPTKPMDVKSSLGGDSGFFALTGIRL